MNRREFPASGTGTLAAADPVLETRRLRLRKMTLDDGEFIVGLFTQSSFLQNIGDRGVNTVADAHRYICEGPMTSYRERGFGFYVVELKDEGDAVGICGLIKRPGLDHVDVGFALLPEFWGNGYATEAAAAALEHGCQRGLDPILAIAQPENRGSVRVLEKIGMRRSGSVRLPGQDTDLEVFTNAPGGAGMDR